MTSPTPNILQRLNAVMQEIDYIQKEKKNGLQYSFASHDKVTALVRPALVKHGIVCYPSGLDLHQEGNRTQVDMTITFASIDNPNDAIHVRTAGYGIDNQDKGPGKAISYAVKYAFLKALSLETGDDPDQDQDVKHDRAPHIPSAPSMPSVQGTPGASKAANRSTYDKLVMAIRNAPTTKALQDWHKANLSEIDALPPDWVDELRVEYNDRKHELNKVLA
jgi:hypothetical protein